MPTSQIEPIYDGLDVLVVFIGYLKQLRNSGTITNDIMYEYIAKLSNILFDLESQIEEEKELE